LCSTESTLAPTTAESGKVLIHTTTKAGGYVAGDVASTSLMKACITNGGGNDAPL